MSITLAQLRQQLVQLEVHQQRREPAPTAPASSAAQPATYQSAGQEGEAGNGKRPVRLTAGQRAALMASKSAEQQEQAARALVLRALTGTPRTRLQLEQLLSQRGVSEQVSRGLLDRFTQVGLIDDARFAHTWVSSRMASKGLARPVLARELADQGVDAATAEAALHQCDAVDELEAARQLVRRRLPSCATKPREVQIRRLVAHLQRKGYGLADSLQAVNEVLGEAGEAREAHDVYD